MTRISANLAIVRVCVRLSKSVLVLMVSFDVILKARDIQFAVALGLAICMCVINRRREMCNAKQSAYHGHEFTRKLNAAISEKVGEDTL